jgi:hypothetical protein
LTFAAGAASLAEGALMHPRYVAIDRERLRRLYVEERLPAEAIARQLGCAVITVLRRLRRFGIPRRPRGACPAARVPDDKDDIPWTAELAYVVGLITTDGCLSRDGRHITLVSKDVDLLEIVRRCRHVGGRISGTVGAYGHHCHRLQWSDRRFHRWLCDIGLMPAKSLRLGALTVPDAHFADFFRGCIDGDGSITTYVDRYNTFKSPTYVYTRLFVSIVSASRPFIDWLRQTTNRLYGMSGFVTVKRSRRAGHSDLWCLKYAKRESLALLRLMYYAPDVPCLHRKHEIALPFLAPRVAPPRRRGRPVVV